MSEVQTEFTNALRSQGWTPRSLPGHMGQVGPLWTCRNGESWRYGLLTEERHLNPAGLVHGGALLTLADQAVSTVAWEACERQPCVTVQLDSQFLTSVLAGEFVQADAVLLQRSQKLLFLRAELRVQERLVMTVQAICKLIGTGASTMA